MLAYMSAQGSPEIWRGFMYYYIYMYHTHILFWIGQLGLNTANLTPMFHFSILVFSLFRGKIEIKTAFQYLSKLLLL